MDETMNIYAEDGDKIVVTEDTKDNGDDSDRQSVQDCLVVGVPYTVDTTIVSGWSTVVFIKEVPYVPFNSVNFKDYDPLLSYAENDARVTQQMYEHFKSRRENKWYSRILNWVMKIIKIG